MDSSFRKPRAMDSFAGVDVSQSSEDGSKGGPIGQPGCGTSICSTMSQPVSTSMNQSLMLSRAVPDSETTCDLTTTGSPRMKSQPVSTLSGEASGWVRWSSSRTDWNHGLGCSHGVESSQPGQQGSMDQLVSTISSRGGAQCVRRTAEGGRIARGCCVAPRTVCAAHTHVCGACAAGVSGRSSQKPSVSAFPRVPLNFGPYPVQYVYTPRGAVSTVRQLVNYHRADSLRAREITLYSTHLSARISATGILRRSHSEISRSQTSSAQRRMAR